MTHPTPTAAARALLAAATPGEWTVDEWTHPAERGRKRYRIRYTATDRMNAGATFTVCAVEGHGVKNRDKANAALIAAAPTLLAQLCDQLDAARMELADLRAVMTEAEPDTADMSLRDGLMRIGKRAAMLVPATRIADKRGAALDTALARLVEERGA